MLDDLVVRRVTAADAPVAAKLCEELGYPVSPDAMGQRIESLSQLADHAIFVACLAGDVVGWIDVGVSHHLQSEARAEIGGLVVSSAVRSAGIGRRLVASAEHWALERGLKSVLVRSQIAREAAHRFYLLEGYARTKTSAVFTKELE